jgi:hypothetical protein
MSTSENAAALAPESPLPPALRKPRLRRSEASQYLLLVYGLAIAPATLAKYASVGGGPCFNRANRIPLYPVTELDAWAEARLGRLVASTSEAR